MSKADTTIQDFKIKPIKHDHKYRRFPKECKDYMEDSENSQCPYCEMNYKDKYIMHTHLYRVHQKYPYRCISCLKTFPKIRLLKLHIEQDHLKSKKKDRMRKSSSINETMSKSRDINSYQLQNSQQSKLGMEGSQMLLSKYSNKMTTSKYAMNQSIIDDMLPICEQVSEEADIDMGEIRKEQQQFNTSQKQQKVSQGNLDTLNQLLNDSNKNSVILNNSLIFNKNSLEENNKINQSKNMERSTLSLNLFNQDNGMEDSQMRKSRSKMTRSQLLFKIARQKQGYNENNKYTVLCKQESKDLDFKRFEPSKQLYRKKKQQTVLEDLNLLTKELNSDQKQSKQQFEFNGQYWLTKKKIHKEDIIQIPCLVK